MGAEARAIAIGTGTSARCGVVKVKRSSIATPCFSMMAAAAVFHGDGSGVMRPVWNAASRRRVSRPLHCPDTPDLLSLFLSTRHAANPSSLRAEGQAPFADRVWWRGGDRVTQTEPVPGKWSQSLTDTLLGKPSSRRRIQRLRNGRRGAHEHLAFTDSYAARAMCPRHSPIWSHFTVAACTRCGHLVHRALNDRQPAVRPQRPG